MKKLLITLLWACMAFSTIGRNLLTPGRMLLRGHITSSDSTVTIPRNGVISIDDVFTSENINQGIEIDSLGNFEVTVSLPYSAPFLVQPAGWMLFMPGDTVSIDFDIATNKMKIDGSEGYQKYYDTCCKRGGMMDPLADLPWPFETRQMSREELQDYIHTIIDRLDGTLGGDDTVLENQVDELIRIYPILGGITQICEARMYYEDRLAEQLRPTDFSPEKFAAYNEEMRKLRLDFSEVYEFLTKKYPNSTINNPAFVVCSSSSPHLINRLEYNEFEELSNDINATNLRKIEVATGISPESLLAQTVISRYYSNRLESQIRFGSQYPFDAAGYVAYIVPVISNQRAATAVINSLRDYIKKYEIPDDTMNPVPDALHELIKPYDGNVIFVDFWNLGCGPCRSGMLNQRKKVEELADKPVKVLYIAPEREKKECEKWLAENEIKGEHIYISDDLWRLMEAKLNFNAIPFSIVIKANRYTKELGLHDIDKWL